MRLTKLLSGISYEILSGESKIEILGLADNSKKVKSSFLFFAIIGTKQSGEVYIREAVNNGATCIVVQNNPKELIEGITYIRVEDVRKIVSLISKNFYCTNGINFKLIGITGTNGKTTTSFMLGETLYKAGYNVCVVGTSGIFVNGKQLRGEGLTTPDPIELFELFGFCASIGVDYVVMEVSAHALALDKTNGLIFDYSIFSNLTEDHLDFFGSMNEYAGAKKKLFEDGVSKCKIINIDDDLGKTMAVLNGNDDKFISYGKKAEYKIVPINNKSFKIIYNNRSIKINLNMPGEYNFYNATSAVIVLLKEGVSKGIIKKTFKNLSKIDGRYNKFKTKYHGCVVLDFAHTPDGLEKLLNNVRKVNPNGRIISVFGCGGNRDRSKRSIMGEISGKLADYTIISIDNPRCEEPQVVMKDIEDGIKKVTRNYDIVMPRVKAIERAISMSSMGDSVVVSGKGTEPYYEVNGLKQFYREDIVIDSIIRKMER